MILFSAYNVLWGYGNERRDRHSSYETIISKLRRGDNTSSCSGKIDT